MQTIIQHLFYQLFILLGVTGIVVMLIITDLYIPTQEIPLLHYLTDIFILLL
jgi:hypothetical protein